MRELLAELDAWTDAFPGAPFDATSLIEVEMSLVRAIRDEDMPTLRLFHERLSPGTETLREKLHQQGFSAAEIQAVTIMTIVRLARAALADTRLTIIP